MEHIEDSPSLHQQDRLSNVPEQTWEIRTTMDHCHRSNAAVQALSIDQPVTRDDVVETQSEYRTCIVRAATLPQTPSMSHRRGIDLNIPQFSQVAISPRATKPQRSSGHDCFLSGPAPAKSAPAQTIHPELLRSHSLGPLTPPHDIEIRWSPENPLARLSTEAEYDSADQRPSVGDAHETAKGLSLPQTPTPQIQPNIQMPLQGSSRLPWIDQALRSISKCALES